MSLRRHMYNNGGIRVYYRGQLKGGAFTINIKDMYNNVNIKDMCNNDVGFMINITDTYHNGVGKGGVRVYHHIQIKGGAR
jgi:hypothetical protein